ncbi:hypothetical protein SAMN04487962_102242 [Marinobacter segnicrescens]|uniref:Uncharacterized protein n=1 Tax=Marinobacter segnicrescens TaxID=430453 RepID=A0A1I0A7E5_9GAMM|nr:hypothetical protein [Marinobacter segnicrescens]SES90054.1 hypothetical protein SAMN04487962_102242 [Marinobacter segnicrescens]
MFYHFSLKKLAALSSALLLSACASQQQSQEQVEIASEALGHEEPEWSTPFWERWTEGGNENQSNAKQRNQSVDNSRKPGRIIEFPSSLATNLAIIGAPDSLYRELDNMAADYGYRLIPRSELSDALTHTPACEDTTSEACAEALAAYPGARLVVTIEGGNAVTITDAASNARWSATELTSGKQGEELLELVSQRADIAPWAMKAFRADDGRLYLSAGRANGLEAGDELAIHEPGTLVRAPNGQPITWRAGERVGTVRIGELFGSDLAALVPVAGQRPTPEHDLVLIDK